MTEIEKIKRYIELTKIPRDTNTRYDLSWNEFVALRIHNVPAADTLYLAYLFGRARGYRAGKKAAQAEQSAVRRADRPRTAVSRPAATAERRSAV